MSKHERPVFVDDSGVRRVIVRTLWLGLLGVALVPLALGTINVVFGEPEHVEALMTDFDAGPYAVSPSAVALPTPTATSACTSVSGEVFIDWDLNGWRSTSDDAETGVADVDVVAFDEHGNAIAQTSTGADGRFRLEWAEPRHVRIEFSSSIAAFRESPVGRWSGTATQFPVAPSCTANLGILWKGTDVGAAGVAARRGVGQASGHVWLDADCDAVLDPGEAGVDAEVLLRDANTGQEYARTSAGAGAFAFGGLEPGVAYEVVVPGAVTTEAGSTWSHRGAMDAAVVSYSTGADGPRASFVLQELGQSSHGLRFPIAPTAGCRAVQP